MGMVKRQMEFRTVPVFRVPGGGDLVSGESINQSRKNGLGSGSGELSSVWDMLNMRTPGLSKISSWRI